MTSDFDLGRYQDALTIQRVLHTATTIAIVGLSSNPMRPSYFVAFYLSRHGYRIIPVNPREREVLDLVVHGLSNKEIAERLSVTVAAVRWHLKHIYHKLHVHSRTEAALKFRPAK